MPKQLLDTELRHGAALLSHDAALTEAKALAGMISVQDVRGGRRL